VPVQYSYTSTPLYSPQFLYSTAIPLLPSVPVQYSYTSTPLCSPLLPSVPVQRCTLTFIKTAVIDE